MESVTEQLQAMIAADDQARPIIRNLRLVSEHLSAVGNVVLTGRTADGREIIIPHEMYNLRPLIQDKIESAAAPRLAKLRELYAPPVAKLAATETDEGDAIIEMMKKQA